MLFSIGCCAEECLGCQKCPEKRAGVGTNRRTHWLGTILDTRYNTKTNTSKDTVFAIITKNKQIKTQLQIIEQIQKI